MPTASAVDAEDACQASDRAEEATKHDGQPRDAHDAMQVIDRALQGLQNASGELARCQAEMTDLRSLFQKDLARLQVDLAEKASQVPQDAAADPLLMASWATTTAGDAGVANADVYIPRRPSDSRGSHGSRRARAYRVPSVCGTQETAQGGDHWVEVPDPDGSSKTYWWNKSTQETTRVGDACPTANEDPDEKEIEATLEGVEDEILGIDDKTFLENMDVDNAADKIHPPPEKYKDLLVGSGCWIGQAEERGITLAQLKALVAHMDKRCVSERWLDDDSQPIAPSTMDVCVADHYVIKPATRIRHCSYVELVADGPQVPVWFVSYWWGEPICDFLSCLSQHSADRELQTDSPYWVCAYANNQWKAEAEQNYHLSNKSFRRAMRLAKGTVSILDGEGVCFSRIWCCYEIFAALTDELLKENHLYDVYTFTEGNSIGLTDGPAAVDKKRERLWWNEDKYAREQAFPMRLAQFGLSVDLQAAMASSEKDRRAILNTVAESSGLDAEPPEMSLGYSKVNFMLWSRFAAATWRKALELSLDMSHYCSALANSELRRLDLSFQKCENLTQDMAAEFITSLPSSLQVLALDFSACKSMCNSVLAALVKRLPANLSSLRLALNETAVDDKGVAKLASRIILLAGLDNLDLLLSSTRVGDAGLKALSTNMLFTLTHLGLDVGNTQVNNGGLECFAENLPPELSSFQFDCGSTEIGDDGAIALVENLPLKLCSLSLQFQNTRVSDDMATSLLNKVFGFEKDLISIHINLDNTDVTDSMLEALRGTVEASSKIEL